MQLRFLFRFGFCLTYVESKQQSNEHNQAGASDFQFLFGHFEYLGYLLHIIAFFCVLSLFNPVWLFVTLGDCSQPGSSVHGGSPGKNAGCISMPSSRGSSWPRDWTHVSYISSMGGTFFITSATWEADILIVLCALIWSLSTLTGLSDNGTSSSEKSPAGNFSNHFWQVPSVTIPSPYTTLIYFCV